MYSQEYRDPTQKKCVLGCGETITNTQAKSHYKVHVDGLEKVDGTDSFRACPECSKVAAPIRLVEHILRDYHKAASFCCPAGCRPEGFSRADAALRHRHPDGTGACKKCLGCGTDFDSCGERYTHEMECRRVAKGVKKQLIETRKRHEKRVGVYRNRKAARLLA